LCAGERCDRGCQPIVVCECSSYRVHFIGGGRTVKTGIIRRVDAFKADLIRSSHFFEISDLLASAVH
jgi:hypothetical protein